VEAARWIRSEHPEVRFVVLGPPDPNPAALRLADVRRWHRDGVIDYVGETDDVRPYIRAASVLVLPSFREGTPRSVLEAMAMARPIVTTDVPGCRETVIDGENGYLVPVRDGAALSRALLRFVDDPSLVDSMGQRSRQIAAETYDVREVTAEILRTLRLAN
jgi:glycosyltransferase involved in cell wall biosynthesis